MKFKLCLLLLAALPLFAPAQSTRISLPAGSVRTSAGVRDAQQHSELVDGRFYRYIQFRGIPTEAAKAKLTALGLRFLDYLPEATYVVSLPAGAVLPAADSSIRAVLAVRPEWKLSEQLAKKKYPKWALRGGGRIELTVLHYSDISSETATAALRSAGFEIAFSSPELHAHRLIVNKTDIARLAALPAVAYLEPMAAEPQPDNLWGRTDHRVNTLSTEYAGGLKFDGTGVRVALNDDGVIGPHIDHQGRIIGQYVSFDNGNHGDHCAGTIFGAGNRNPTARGMASGAELGVYGVSNNFPSGYQAFDSIYNHYTAIGTRIVSTSYSDGNNTGYTTRARLMDIQMNNLPELVHVFSSGNAGTSNFGWGAGAGWANITGGHKQAKNVITVGNLTYQDALNSSSSRGPARDGRIKPEVCAVGTDVNSTIANNAYDVYTGTSMACPGVAGTLALLYEAYKAGNGGANPPSALIKAAVMNTADDLGNPGPDYRYGYGRINARRAHGIISAGQYLRDSLGQGQTKTHSITVPAGVAELRVMLYWHDKPAVAGAQRALVNNLNASLSTPAAATVLPWVLNPTPNATAVNQTAVQGIDSLNNAEQITVPAPAAGVYTFTVDGFAVPQGPQQYVVVYEFVTEAPVLTYPIGGESFVTAAQETIRWDAYGNTGTFLLEYSTSNGASWSTIAAAVPAAQRFFNWVAPSIVTGHALVRVTRNGQSAASSAPFSIIGVPGNLNVSWVCTDSMRITYNAVPGATGYVVSMLGSEYMDSVAFSTTNSCIVYGSNVSQGGWVSVHAVGADSCTGRRAIAVPFQAAPFNCTVPADVEVVAALSPLANTFTSCNGAATTEFVTVTVRNNGPGVASGLAVKYAVNGGPAIAQALPQPLPAGSLYNLSFVQPIIFTQPGTHTIRAWTEGIMDPVPGNDSVTWYKAIHASPLVSLPFSENFESFNLCDSLSNCEATVCQLSGGWYNASVDSDDHIDWRVHAGPTPGRAMGELTGPQQDYSPGTPVGKYLYLESSGCAARLATLLSPCIDLTGVANPSLSFGAHLFGASQGSLSLDVLADGQWSSGVHVVSGDRGDSWQLQQVDLAPFAGKVINLRFRGLTGGDHSDMAIDDVQIRGGLAVGSAEAAGPAMQVAPNPSGGDFYLTLNGAADGEAQLALNDAAGRLVVSQTLTIRAGRATAVVPGAGLPAGLYLLSVKGLGLHLQAKVSRL